MVSAQTNEEASRIFGEVHDMMKKPHGEGEVEDGGISNPSLSDCITDGNLFVSLSPEWTEEDKAAWLVDGILPMKENGILHSTHGVGKTFFLLDLSCCIATGIPFFGHSVEQGVVAFIGAEGKRSFKKRLKLWCLNHSEADEKLVLGNNANLVFLNPEVPDPLVRKDLPQWNRIIRVLKEKYGERMRAVFIDTLSTHNDGDENSEKTAKDYLLGAKKAMIELECTVCSAHHNVKNATEMRGSSGFGGNVDFLLELRDLRKFGETESSCVFRTEKFKDAEANLYWFCQFKTEKIPECFERNGNPVTSKVITSFDFIGGEEDYSKIRPSDAERAKKKEEILSLLRRFLSERGIPEFNTYALRDFLKKERPECSDGWIRQQISIGDTSHGYLKKWMDNGWVHRIDRVDENGDALHDIFAASPDIIPN